MAGATWIPMARYFQQITSIEPYSIDQTRKLDVRLSMASVYKARNGNRWLDPGFSGSYDLQVFHPFEDDTKERPSWTFVDGRRTLWKTDATLCQGSFPCLVQAFIESEGTMAVPMDQVEVDDPNQTVNLMLPHGRFVIRSMARNRLEIAKITIDAH